MTKIPVTLREITAKNIRSLREKRFPGHGGVTECAKVFGVTPQVWSPWETGTRMPSEENLAKLAIFFHVTVEYLRSETAAESQEGYNGPGRIKNLEKENEFLRALLKKSEELAELWKEKYEAERAAKSRQPNGA